MTFKKSGSLKRSLCRGLYWELCGGYAMSLYVNRPNRFVYCHWLYFKKFFLRVEGGRTHKDIRLELAPLSARGRNGTNFF